MVVGPASIAAFVLPSPHPGMPPASRLTVLLSALTWRTRWHEGPLHSVGSLQACTEPVPDKCRVLQ